jgi:hypothetical protein
MKDDEIWVDIVGYENLYQISNKGRVKSLRKTIDKGKWGEVIFPEKILKQFERSNIEDYLCINLYKNKKAKTHSVHRLLAIAFIPNPHNKPHINHINCIKNDCRIENLEWCTPSENALHAIRNGRVTILNGEKNVNSVLTEVAVRIIRNSRYKISRKELSETFGVSIAHIDRVRCRQRWKHI